MSSAAPNSRVRRRDGDDEQQPEDTSQLRAATQTAVAAGVVSQPPSAADAEGAQPQPQFAGVQPLPELFGQRNKPRRSFNSTCCLDKLAVVELQLCLQFLDTRSRLKAARCNQRLLQAAIAQFPWSSASPFAITAQSAADVERVQTSLLRFAPIHLHCVGMKSLQCVATVPHLWGLELQIAPHSSAADLRQLLQHPCMTRLQSLLLLDKSYRGDAMRLTVDVMRLVARLPQLRTLDVYVAIEDPDRGATALQPLVDCSALTDLTVRWGDLMLSDDALLGVISHCAALRRLSLRGTLVGRGTFRSLFQSAAMRQLQHLEIHDFMVAIPQDVHARSFIVEMFLPDEYRDAFSALQQLQTLTLRRVIAAHALLRHVPAAKALRLLSIRYLPNADAFRKQPANSPHPNLDPLRQLLTEAPQLQVHLLMPAAVEGSQTVDTSGLMRQRASHEKQRRDLQRMAAELGSERVTVVFDDEP